MLSPYSLRRSLFLAILILIAHSSAAVAQSSWAVAQRPDESLKGLVGKLMPHADKVPGADDAGAVILYKQHFLKSMEKNYEVCTNLVFLVKDPSRVGGDLSAPYLDGDGHYPERNAFILRGDKILRYDEEKSEVVTAVDDIHRDQVLFDLAPLQKGDVVGWSVVQASEGMVPPWMSAAGDRYPVVYSSVRILNDGSSNFALEGYGFPKGDFAATTDGLVNDRPKEWKGRGGDFAPVENLPGTPPYPATVPVFAIATTERHADNPNGYRGWIPLEGWLSVSATLSAAREEILKNTGNLDIQASALTTGLSDDAAKEKAVCEYVRDKIKVLDGDAYDRSGMRTMKEVMSAKEATPFEKAALMLALLDAAGVQAELGVVRPESWGALDGQASKTFIAFDAWVVRCGGQQPRYYAPDVSGLEAGTLPSDWGKAAILSPMPGLLEEFKAYRKKVGSEAFAKAGKVDPRKLTKEAEGHATEKGWYRIEALGGSK